MLDVMVADVAVLLVGDALVVLDLSAQGVSRKVQQSLDPTRPLGQLACQDTAATILLESGGAALAQQVVAGAAVLLAFEQIGGAAAEGAGSRDEVPVRPGLDTTEAAGTELASVRDCNRSGAKL